MLSSFFRRIQAYPRNLFLIDAFGALLSAFLLGVVLVRFDSLFGIPIPTLYYLASFPILFALFDFIICFSRPIPLNRYLRWIALSNLFYCVLSLSAAVYYSDSLTPLGWIYILTEVAIVTSIAVLELKIATSLGK